MYHDIENMRTKKNETQTFLVLVPHRDARIELQKQSESLFKNGLVNVYPFPHAAPLASLSKPFNADELKHFARVLRETAGKEKFRAVETSFISISLNNENMTLFGHNINIDISLNLFAGSSEKINNLFTSAVIGSFMFPDTVRQIQDDPRQKKYPSMLVPVKFRAAAAANMFWKAVRINDEICYKWKIGKLFWLPRTINTLHK